MDVSGQRVVELRTHSGGTLLLIGTAHISSTDPALVRSIIRRTQPDTVAVELCSVRAQAMGIARITKPSSSHPEPSPVLVLITDTDFTDAESGSAATWGRLRSVDVAYPQPGPSFPGLVPVLTQVLLGSTMAALGDLLHDKGSGGGTEGGRSSYGALGSEMSVAGAEAASLPACRLLLIDRSMGLTFARAAPHLTMSDLLGALPTALAGVHLPPKYVAPAHLLLPMLYAAAVRDWSGPWGVSACAERMLEHALGCDPAWACSHAGRILDAYNRLILLPIRDGVLSTAQCEALRSAFVLALSASESLPEMKESLPAAFGAERDLLLAHALYAAPGRTVVGVVGRGHLEGIRNLWPTLQEGGAGVEELLRPPPWHTMKAVVLPGACVLGYAVATVRCWRVGRRTAALSLLAGAGLYAGAVLMVGSRVVEASGRVKRAIANPV